MAITDYIPNIFGQAAPSYIQGLLGAEETQNLQNRANVQGLLGAGLALAQGMSRTGPRRSAAENVLGALAGGFGAAGGAYDQGIKNYVTQQQIAQTQLAQKQAANQLRSIEEAKLKYPDIAQLADIDRAKFAEEVALRQRMAGLGKQQGQQGPETPESLRAQAQSAYMMGPQFKPFADSLAERANRLEVESRLRPQAPAAGVQQPAQEVAAEAAPGSLPGVTVTEDKRLFTLKQELLNQNQAIAGLSTAEARAQREANEKSIKAIDDQLKQFSAAFFDWNKIEKDVPPNFKVQVDGLRRLSEGGFLPLEQIRIGVQDIYKQAQESAKGMRLDGIVGTYAQMKYGTMDQTKLTPDQMKDIIRFQNAPDAAKQAEIAREATKLQAEFGVSAPVPAGRGEFVGRGGVRQQVVVPEVAPASRAAPAPRVAPSDQVAPTTAPVAAPETVPQAAPESKFVPKSISDKALINQPSNVLPLVKRQELLQAQPATESLVRYTLRNVVDARNSAQALLDNPKYLEALSRRTAPLRSGTVLGVTVDPETLAANELLQNLLTRSFVTSLQQMRTASPTGGAVGNVAVAEMEALSKIQASMKLGMSKDELIRQLKQYVNVSEKSIKDLPNEYARTYSYKGEFDDILEGNVIPPALKKDGLSPAGRKAYEKYRPKNQ
jgi:hypothetical protein